MPLQIEAYNPELSEWLKIGDVKPNDPPGSFSQNRPDGSRELYLFECAEDNSQSTIYRSPFGIDTEIGNLRAVLNDRTEWEVMKVLRKDDEPFRITIKTDNSPQRRVVRFTHI